MTLESRIKFFFFAREGDGWLTVLRVGLGLQFALFCLSLRADWTALFGFSGSGFVSSELSDLLASATSPVLPKLGWLLVPAQRIGLTDNSTLFLIWIVLLAAACSLTVGFWCRPCAMAAWFLHLCLANSRTVLAYGVDEFMTIGMFYLMLSPLPYSLQRP